MMAMKEWGKLEMQHSDTVIFYLEHLSGSSSGPSIMLIRTIRTRALH